MIRNEICCDICGLTVARKDNTWFAKYHVVKPYVTVPYPYRGICVINGIPVSVDSKGEKHICDNCMEKFVYKAIDEKKEQGK
jgi:hypothetical protein